MKTDKLSMRIKVEHITKQMAQPSKSLTESPSCHNGFPLDLEDHKNKWSCHQFFLHGCDR